jgi:hypothetical protein
MVRLTLASLAAAVVLLIGAVPALGDSASISVTTAVGQPDPVANVPRVFTVTGTASVSERLYIKHRPAGGSSCAPTAVADPGRWLTGFMGAPVSGSFNVPQVIRWDASGPYMFCFWLAGSDNAIVTPTIQNITFRRPTGTMSATLSPLVPRPNQYTTVTISGASEAPERVYAKVRPGGGAPCAATYDADPGANLRNGEDVDGAFVTRPLTSQPDVGQYLICMWLAGASDDSAPIAGPIGQLYNVVQPPAVALRLTPLNCHDRRMIRTVRATRVKAVCVRYTFATEPRNGARVSVSFVTPRHKTQKVVSSIWEEGSKPTVTVKSLTSRAYRRRHGKWQVVLRVNGKEIRRTSFRVR